MGPLMGPPRTPNVPQGDGIPRAVAREACRERAIVLGNPHRGMRVEPGVRPRQHPGGLVLVEESEAHAQPQHGAAERLCQPTRVVGMSACIGAGAVASAWYCNVVITLPFVSRMYVCG